ncbi:calcium-binding protein [Moorena sp. SIO3I6]|uniref:calcium-binding protein n=1 Tax=Moorena sp. SIO3I6 TaxID=2607831 RepID=UPI0013F9F886|nr:calcium-binding protein [Moorena sp. SIO3I6]NEP26440.1 calcium-binding protein [Moorena sp. SIO3I6]
MAISVGKLNQYNLEYLPENDIFREREGDNLFGKGGNDVVSGDQGDDVIQQGNQGNDKLFLGGEGDDVILGKGGNDVVSGDQGDDVIQGNEGNDQLFGGEGDDVIQGGAGNDRIWGDSGNDVLQGGAGNDTFRDSAGVNYFDGGEGRDTVDFHDLINSGIKLNLAEGTGSYTDEQDQEVAQTLISIEKAVGTNFNDELIGNEANNMFFGLEGDDKYVGGAGNDTFRDSGGSNHFDGGEGRDTVDFQNLINSGIKLNLAEDTGSYTDEQDQEVAQTLISIERALGTNFNDELTGNEVDNMFFGLEGDDKQTFCVNCAGNNTFRDSGGSNHFDGGEGRDTVDFQNLINSGIKLNLAEDTGSYTDEQDQELAQTLISIERALGTNFNDELTGNEVDNTLFGKKNLKLAEEYRQLIALPVLSELEANRMAKILELANLDESLNCLIEEIEMTDYLKLEQWNQGLRNLLKVISTEEPSPSTPWQD